MDIPDGAVVLDGLDVAIVGKTTKDGEEVLVYAEDKIINLFVERDGMTRDEALEFFLFNIECAYMGVRTPIYIYN
jgi:hypothetical protein